MAEPIDLLLAALSQTTDNGSSGTVTENQNENVGEVALENDEHSRRTALPSQNSSPINTARRIRLSKLLSSSSLKRKQVKSTNCFFCQRFQFCRKQVESHLTESPLCQALYLRKFKVKHLDGILIKLYRCISCGLQGTYALKRHLESHPGCFRFYKERFLVQDWKQLNTKLLNLARPSYSSRRPLKRQLVNAAFQAKKKDTKTITMSLNEFKKTTSLANFRMCVLCLQFQLRETSIKKKD